MNRTFAKITAYILVLSMTFLFAQPQVYAAELGKAEVSVVEPSVEAQKGLPHHTISEKMEKMELSAFTEKLSTDKELKVIGEDTSLRTPSTKYLVVKDKDGKESFIEMNYGSSVHYLDNGTWKDIDNTFKATRRTNGKEYFENTSNILKTAFTKRSGSDSLFEVSYEDITMKWTLLGANGSEAEVSDSTTLRSSKITDNVKNISSVKYQNIKPDTDINYTVKGVNVKEDIIVRSAQDKYEYQFVLELQGATPKMQDNGEIIIHTKSRGGVFTIASPYMYDANGRESTSVKYTLERLNECEWLITVVADENWINSEETAFPVCIDPSLILGSPYDRSRLSVSYHTNYTGQEEWVCNIWDAQVGKSSSGSQYWLEVYTSFYEGDFLDIYDKLTSVYIRFYYQSSFDTHLMIRANDGTLVDVVPVSTTEEGTWGYLYFDLTKHLRNSIESGQNFSQKFIIEQPETETGMVTLVIDAEEYSDHTWHPSFEIYYNEDIGLASHYTYNQTTVGSSGTLLVNYYTGKPMFVYNDGNLYGNIMPLSLYHTFDQGKWLFSLDESYSYNVYRNGFGAKIQVLEHLNKILDTSGLGLTFEKQGTDVIITDKQQNQHIFIKPYSYSENKLSQIKDRNGNTVTIGDNTVTGASGEIYNIEYNSYGLMTRFIYPDNQEIVYTYDTQKRLSTVTNLGNTTTFTYDDEGRISSVTDSLSQTKIVISYDAKSRVTQITEQTANGTASGQTVKFAYNFDYRTDYTISGNDDIIDTADDVTVSVQFDRWGRTTGSYYEADGKLISTATEYHHADENSSYADLRKNNKPTTSGISSSTSANILLNGSMESSTNWFATSVSANSAVECEFPLVSNESKYGNYSAKVTSTATGNHADVIMQEITLSPGTYTLSAYVKAENISGSYGAFIGTWEASSSTNNYTSVSMLSASEYINGTTAEFAEGGWRRISYTFTLSTTTTLCVGGGIRSATGTAYFDCFQLEKGSYVSDYNLVENGGFDFDNQTQQHAWHSFGDTITQIDGDNVLTAIPSESNAAALVLGQAIPIKKTGISSIYVSCWTKINSTPTLFLSDRFDTLSVQVTYNDGSSENKKVNANSLDTEWQYLSFMVLTDPEKTIDTIYIDFFHLTHPNPAFVDDVSIVVADGTKYEYDDEGNIISSDPAESDESTMEYDALNRLTSLTDALGKTFTYTYDDNGNMTHAESSIGTYIDATYDNRGLATSSTTSGNTETENGIVGTDKKLYTSATYTNNGGYTSSVTDSTGLTATYDYNALNGLLNHTYTSDNPTLKTRYSYTTLKQLAQLFVDQNGNGTLDSSESSVNYQYNNKAQLQSITANGMTYTFSYDVFGNMTSVGISGRTPLATYNYGAYNGKLQSVTYANGTTLTYEYDDLERLKKVRNGNTVVEEYTYDLFGNVTKLTDGNWTQSYIYDDFNRLIETQSGGNGELRAQYGYDAQSRLNKVLYEYTRGGGISDQIPQYNPQSFYEYEYGLNDAINKVKHNSESLLEYLFDSLGRRQSILYSKLTQDNSAYNAVFTYKDSTVGENASTPLVSTITYPDHSYGYTYKSNGDIEAVTYTYGTTIYTSFYHYDDLRRLVREDNGYKQRTYTYEYDASGNILSRKEYSYTAPTAQVGTATSTYTYTYGDSTWKDLLTSYNGESIVYDAVGNPTTYRGKAFTWDNNIRKPVTMQTEDGYLDLFYDATGARRVKQYDYGDNTELHFYHYDGSTLLYESISKAVLDGDEFVFEETSIEYIVDETGSPVGMIVNGTEYYFAKNLQGDVQRIYTANGTLVGEYHYDAWGNHTIVTDIDGIASLNPFRYRSYYYDSETGLYYLNSRYYDPETGRFISADGYVSTGQGMSGYNMFAYCLDNPVKYEDPNGDVAGEALLYAGGMKLICTNLWNPVGWTLLGVTVLAVGILVIPWDSVGESISNGWDCIKNSARSASISYSISKAVAKAKTKIRIEKTRYDYWVASYVDYGDNKGTYIPTTPLSYAMAISYVRGGGDVFADSKRDAYKLAKAVGTGDPVRDPAHHGEEGYWKHYHATQGGERIGGHIFYVS